MNQSHDSNLPARIGEFPVEGHLGSGGMGDVYKVRDPYFDRELALKLSRHGSDDDARALVRFVGEGRLVAQLQHPSIPPVYHLAQDENGHWFYTMKRVRGVTLASVLKNIESDPKVRDEWPLRRVLTTFVTVCKAVAYAHSRGVIHRDLKPQNIMLGDFGEVYVMDWGLAKVLGRNLNKSMLEKVAPQGSQAIPMAAEPERSVSLTQSDIAATIVACKRPAAARSDALANTLLAKPGTMPATPSPSGSGSSEWGADSDSESPVKPFKSGQTGKPAQPSDHFDSSMTMQGDILGTPAYMAPEQARGEAEKHDQRTDVYALGVILCEILTGQQLRSGRKVSAIMKAAMKGERQDFEQIARERGVEPDLKETCWKALEPDSQQRHQTVFDLANDLLGWLDGIPKWRVVAKPDLVEPDALKRWGEVKGDMSLLWRVNDGTLEAIGTDEHSLLYNVRFAGDLRLSCTAWCGLGSPAELSIHLCSSNAIGVQRTTTAGYCLQFGGKALTCVNLTRHQRDVAQVGGLKPEPGRKYHFVAEAAEGLVRLLADGKELIRWEDPSPLRGGYVGFYAYGAGARYTDVVIESRGNPLKVSVLETPDFLYADGQYEKAMELYKEVAESHPAREEGALARYKSGLCLARMKQYPEARRVFATLRSDPHTLPLGILGETHAIDLEAHATAQGEMEAAKHLLTEVRKAASFRRRWQAVQDYAFDRTLAAFGRSLDDPIYPIWFESSVRLAGGLKALAAGPSQEHFRILVWHFIYPAAKQILSQDPGADDAHPALQELFGELYGAFDQVYILGCVRQARYALDAQPMSEVNSIRQRIAALQREPAENEPDALNEAIAELTRRYPSLPHRAWHLKRDLQYRTRTRLRSFTPRQSVEHIVVNLTDGTVAEFPASWDFAGSDTFKTTHLVLKRIPAGAFMMGNDAGDHEKHESPVHEVILTNDFYIGVFQVTQRQWFELMGFWPSFFNSNPERRPVEQVSWYDAQEFLVRLSQEAGLPFMLPTEAQWEYACKAERATNFLESADDMWSTQDAAYETHDVGLKKPNPWNLYDMHGNVWEWCSDWYGAHYYSESPTDNPVGPETGELRVLRGGSWCNYPKQCGVAYRGSHKPFCQGSFFGFRVVMSAPASTQP